MTGGEATSGLKAERKGEPSLQRRVVGGYVLTRLLGRGGMADVWLGVHEVSRGLAAVKILRHNSTDHIRALFERERSAVLRLRHPNIVPIFDVGEDFIAAAYIEGVDLRHRMRSPLTPAEAVAITCSIGSALAAAHEQGVIHCDVKPGNILLDRSGTPFLVDFGIAWLSFESALVDQAPGAGTPAYMAPEQSQGRWPTPATDQFSLAKTLLAMLMGQRLKSSAASSLEFLSNELREAVGDTLLRAMAELPTARFASVQGFINALKAADTSELQPSNILVNLRRDHRPFAWVKRPIREERIGESIARVDYSLSDLEGAGLLERDAVARFRQRTGHVDFTWSMYAREERLGPLTQPFALARSQETAVLMHGLFTNREVWKDVAVGIARDNGLSVTLTPDLLGFGESPFADEAPSSACSPDRIVPNTMEWLELIGLGEAPTVMLGHSVSASALLCTRQTELGSEVHRICITPGLPALDQSFHITAILYWLSAIAMGWFPRRMLRAVAHAFFQRDPSLQRITPSARGEMAESAIKLGAGRVASLLKWLKSAQLAPAEEIRESTIVTTDDDPLVDFALVEKTVRDAGIPEEQCFHLLYGGHFPHLIDDAHPEWGARNVHELVSVIDTVLDMAHEKSADRRAKLKCDEETESLVTAPELLQTE